MAIGFAAARKGDQTAHDGEISSGYEKVTIGGLPAARFGDSHICTMSEPSGVHKGGKIVEHSSSVRIGGAWAARKFHKCICKVEAKPIEVAPEVAEALGFDWTKVIFPVGKQLAGLAAGAGTTAGAVLAPLAIAHTAYAMLAELASALEADDKRAGLRGRMNARISYALFGKEKVPYYAAGSGDIQFGTGEGSASAGHYYGHAKDEFEQIKGTETRMKDVLREDGSLDPKKLRERTRALETRARSGPSEDAAAATTELIQLKEDAGRLAEIKYLRDNYKRGGAMGYDGKWEGDDAAAAAYRDLVEKHANAAGMGLSNKFPLRDEIGAKAKDWRSQKEPEAVWKVAGLRNVNPVVPGEVQLEVQQHLRDAREVTLAEMMAESIASPLRGEGDFISWLVDDFAASLTVQIAIEEAIAEQQAAAESSSSADNAIVTGEESVLIG